MLAAVKTIVTILYVLICIALVIIVLMQEGKNAGLSGAIDGIADSYWGKNKGRSIEGTLVKITRLLAVLFIVLSIVLSMSFWN